MLLRWCGRAKSSKTTAAVAEPAPASPRPAEKPKPVAPTRNDAISLLATLQREARFLDIVKEPLGDYSDAQVGAAARDVLRDCEAVLDRMFKIKPIVEQAEGDTVELPADTSAGQFRVTGQGGADAKSGSLVHHGWQATQCELPKWTGDEESALIVAPAELEV